MAIPTRYQAAWVPGFNTDFDPDTAIALGERWLFSRADVKGRIVVMNAAKMAGNRPSLARLAGRVPFVSPQTRSWLPDGPLAVLAIYPTNKTLHFAEARALDGALCVIPGTIDDVTSWVARSQAINLAAPDELAPALPAIDPEVKEILDGTISFGGNNDFYGGYEKDRAVRDLREIVAARRGLTPEALEGYALSTGEVRTPDGAARLRQWYEGVLAGKRYKGERGQWI